MVGGGPASDWIAAERIDWGAVRVRRGRAEVVRRAAWVRLLDLADELAEAGGPGSAVLGGIMRIALDRLEWGCKG